MGEYVIRMPDVGEGVAEAEIVEWHVKKGDLVREDTVLAAVMTDKATVEIPSPSDGEVVSLGGEVGDQITVGSELVRLKVEGEGNTAPTDKEAVTPMNKGPEEETLPPPEAPRSDEAPQPLPTVAPPPRGNGAAMPPGRLSAGAPRGEGERPIASPAVRLRAREVGIDLRQVPGSGPAGRITHEDIDAFIARGPQGARPSGMAANNAVETVKVAGLRRRIAERMATARDHITPITYVDEVDVTALEELRATLNRQKRQDQPKLTLLPFLMRAIVRAVGEHPAMNALYDDEEGVIHQHGGVHIGIASQTAAGLMVPVVRHAEARDLWDCAAEMRRLSEAARDGSANRDELTGSTITITSLGALGGIVTTPVINYPEVAIVGVNKIAVRPVWDGSTFIPRKMMNLSSSFDHRVIDGWDAAVFVQRIKALIETPAMIFVGD